MIVPAFFSPFPFHYFFFLVSCEVRVLLLLLHHDDNHWLWRFGSRWVTSSKFPSQTVSGQHCILVIRPFYMHTVHFCRQCRCFNAWTTSERYHHFRCCPYIFYIAYYIRPFITYSHFFFLLYILNFLGWTQYRSKNVIQKTPYNTAIPVFRCVNVYIYRLLIIRIRLLTQIITPVFHFVHLRNLIVYWNKCVYESMLCLIMVYVLNPFIGLLQSRKLLNSKDAPCPSAVL